MLPDRATRMLAAAGVCPNHRSREEFPQRSRQPSQARRRRPSPSGASAGLSASAASLAFPGLATGINEKRTRRPEWPPRAKAPPGAPSRAVSFRLGQRAHRFGGIGPPGRTLWAKNASTSGLGSLGSAILSSARRRFSRFWLVAATTVGNGGRLGGAAAGCFALGRGRLLSGSGFGACTTTVAAISTARGFFFGGGRL